MNLVDVFNIKNKDIITIVGAGGKTSLMFSASSLLRKDYKVLVTTTTNIYVPDSKTVKFDKLCLINNDEELDSILKNDKNGIYVIGSKIKDNSNKPKLKGLTFEMLDKISPFFDILLIEGDGSKEKPLKGWIDSEPVVYDKTTKTIGVIDINSIGLEINEDNIHRLDNFLNIVSDNKSSKVNVNHLKNITLNKNGLFKLSKGEKILFINKSEGIINKTNANLLIKKIKDENSSYIDKFVYGSLINNEFFTLD